MRLSWLLMILLCTLVGTACEEFEDAPPASPTVPDVPPTQFDLTGRWDGVTNQGRPLRFDVRPAGNVERTTMTIHHDCSGGRLVLQMNGYESKVDSDSFSRTITWRKDLEGGKWYVGTLTVSGTFTGDTASNGAFINSITDKQVDNLGVCGPSSGTWQASRSQ